VTKKGTKNIIKYDDHGICIQNFFNVKTKPIYYITKSTGKMIVSFTKKMTSILRKTLQSYVTYPGSARFMFDPFSMV